jgi:hypothetical protein
MLTRATKWGWLLILMALVLLGTCSLQAAIPGIVVLGTDYFQTVPGVSNVSGTWFDFGGPIGIVDFMGLPVGPWNTDTIVQRQADADLTVPSPIPLQIVTLSLESRSTVDIGGTFFRVFVTLDPANLSRDIGTMTIVGNTMTGGTFTSSLNVFFDAHFQPVTTGNPFDIFSEITLDNSGASWTPTPPPGAVLVHGPLGDQQANCHAPDPFCLPAGSDLVDFFGSPIECSGPGGCHVVIPASTPEPSSLLLLGPAGIGLLWKLSARRSAKV